MNFLDVLKPESLENFVRLFAVGYVFGEAVRKQRVAKKESEFRSSIKAIVASVLLVSLFDLFGLTVVPGLPPGQTLFLSTSSYLGASYILGTAYALCLIHHPKVLRKELISGYVHVTQKKLASAKDRFVELNIGESWYQGIIQMHDLDADRYLDCHISLVHVSVLIKGSWMPLPGVDSLVISMKDVKQLRILKPVFTETTETISATAKEKRKTIPGLLRKLWLCCIEHYGNTPNPKA